jgi:hypothetical protein
MANRASLSAAASSSAPRPCHFRIGKPGRLEYRLRRALDHIKGQVECGQYCNAVARAYLARVADFAHGGVDFFDRIKQA